MLKSWGYFHCLGCLPLSLSMCRNGIYPLICQEGEIMVYFTLRQEPDSLWWGWGPWFRKFPVIRVFFHYIWSPWWEEQRCSLLSVRPWGPGQRIHNVAMPRVSLNPTQEDGWKPRKDKKISLRWLDVYEVPRVLQGDKGRRVLEVRVKGKREKVVWWYHFQIFKMKVIHHVKKSTLSFLRFTLPEKKKKKHQQLTDEQRKG